MTRETHGSADARGAQAVDHDNGCSLIIAGSRGFLDGSLFSDEDRIEAVDEVVRNSPFTVAEVVSGGARGADTAGEAWARSHDVPVAEFDPSRPAETRTSWSWDEHGSGAGYKRNCEMAEYADALVAIWDGSSPGTQSMIEIGREVLGADSVHVHVYR